MASDLVRASVRGSRRSWAPAAMFAALAAAAGCGGSGSIPNLNRASPALPAMACYGGPRMNEPRYGHTATPLGDGSVLVVGGTDELHLTALAAVEVFDPSARVEIGEPVPESIAGDFIDQDIDGNPIELASGGRFFHTATVIDDENVLVIGGTSSILYGVSIGASEVFDPATRRFGVAPIDPADDIIVPRARHSAHRLAGGRVLITGGQEAVTVLLPSAATPAGPAQQSREARPSTGRIEIFDPATLAFAEAVDHLGSAAELTTARGRAGHATGQWAGFDGHLNTSDDIYGLLGGFMTLSALSLAAPEDYLPWNPLTAKLTAMDYYDPVSGTVSLAQGLLLARRVNDPIAVNLGADHPLTPFGDPGMANAVYILGGDADGACPEGAPPVGEGTTDHGELVIATFTGFGPAGGVRFSSAAAGVVSGSSTFANGHELAVLGPPCGEFSRSRTGAVLMDMLRIHEGEARISSVVVTGGGIEVVGGGGCATISTGLCAGEVRGFQFFDPFYDVAAIGEAIPLDDDLDDDGHPDLHPWEWRDRGTTLNPLGLRGTTLHFDDRIPSGDIDGYADGSGPVGLGQARALHTLTRIPGEDGIPGNLDDRIVAIGGTGQYWPSFGDDPLPLSSEIFLPPDAGTAP